jgi:hypothetical protein
MHPRVVSNNLLGIGWLPNFSFSLAGNHRNNPFVHEEAGNSVGPKLSPTQSLASDLIDFWYLGEPSRSRGSVGQSVLSYVWEKELEKGWKETRSPVLSGKCGATGRQVGR